VDPDPSISNKYKERLCAIINTTPIHNAAFAKTVSSGSGRFRVAISKFHAGRHDEKNCGQSQNFVKNKLENVISFRKKVLFIRI
jgi:hypothetical protein